MQIMNLTAFVLLTAAQLCQANLGTSMHRDDPRSFRAMRLRRITLQGQMVARRRLMRRRLGCQLHSPNKPNPKCVNCRITPKMTKKVEQIQHRRRSRQVMVESPPPPPSTWRPTPGAAPAVDLNMKSDPKTFTFPKVPRAMTRAARSLSTEVPVGLEERPETPDLPRSVPTCQSCKQANGRVCESHSRAIKLQYDNKTYSPQDKNQKLACCICVGNTFGINLAGETKYVTWFEKGEKKSVLKEIGTNQEYKVDTQRLKTDKNFVILNPPCAVFHLKIGSETADATICIGCVGIIRNKFKCEIPGCGVVAGTSYKYESSSVMVCKPHMTKMGKNLYEAVPCGYDGICFSCKRKQLGGYYKIVCQENPKKSVQMCNDCRKQIRKETCVVRGCGAMKAFDIRMVYHLEHKTEKKTPFCYSHGRKILDLKGPGWNENQTPCTLCYRKANCWKTNVSLKENENPQRYIDICGLCAGRIQRGENYDIVRA